MAKRPDRPSAGRPPRAKVKALSHRLKDLLAQEQLRAKAPKGMAKCPLCGSPVAPSRNRRVRVHDDPMRGGRCPAATRLWEEFGRRAPPVATPRGKDAAARTRKRRA